MVPPTWNSPETKPPINLSFPILWHFISLIACFLFLIYYFDCAGSSLQGTSFLFSSCSEQGLLSSCGKQASHWGGLSCGAQALRCMGFSRCYIWALVAPRLWSTGFVALWQWDLPGSGIKPVSPALAGRFFTTESPGKPHFAYFYFYIFFLLFHYSMMGFSYFLKGPSECLLIVTSDTQTDIQCCAL